MEEGPRRAIRCSVVARLVGIGRLDRGAVRPKARLHSLGRFLRDLPRNPRGCVGVWAGEAYPHGFMYAIICDCLSSTYQCFKNNEEVDATAVSVPPCAADGYVVQSALEACGFPTSK
jgi:hypothetical protein